MPACEALATKSELEQLNSNLLAQIAALQAQLNNKAENQRVNDVENKLNTKAEESWVNDLIGGLLAKIESLNDGLSSAITSLKEEISNAAMALKQKIEDATSYLLGKIQEALDFLFSKVSKEDFEALRDAFLAHIAKVIPDAHFLDLSEYVKKNSGLSINGSYENGGINIGVSSDLGDGSTYVDLFLDNYALKTDLDNHISLPIPDAHDYEINLDDYVKKNSGIEINGSYENGGVNLSVSCELGSDSQFIDLFLGDFVSQLDFENHVSATISNGVHGGFDIEGSVSLDGSYENGGINLSIATPFGNDSATIDLFLDSYALKIDLDNKVDKNQDIFLNGSYFDGNLNLSISSNQIGSDSVDIPIYIDNTGGDGVPWGDFRDHLNDPNAHNIGQSAFEAFWDGSGIGFSVVICGNNFSDTVTIPPAIDMELIEKEDGEELKITIRIGSESDSESVFLMSNSTVNKIYQILGGDRWFPQSGESPRFKPDTEIRAKCLGHYDGDSNEQATGLPTSDLIELIWSSQAPNYQKLGFSDYPGNAPKTLLNIGSDTETIPNLPQFLLWITKQLDSLIGEFPIKIKIQDTDLTQEGNQEKTLAIGNLAEGISELFGLAFSGASLNDAELNILLRMIPEVIRIRQLLLTTQDICIANRDFLGYPEKEVVEEVESNFSTLKKLDNIARLLEPETQKYKTIEFEGKDTLMSYLTRLQYVASLQKSVLMKSQQDFENFVEKSQEQATDDNWDNFVTTINDPLSQFNIGEKVSRIRDIE